jgi:2-oxoisovalerate dehydrogenase E1 component beta subunit
VNESTVTDTTLREPTVREPTTSEIAASETTVSETNGSGTTVTDTSASAATSPLQSMPMAKALNAGLRQAMLDNPKVLLMGEDIGPLGGVFRVTEGLQAEFGVRRVTDTPLAESGIVGTAIGLAMRGYRPVCEIQFDGFVYPSFNQITSQLAKMTNRHEGQIQMPVVIRIPYGGHIGAVEHHQESPEAYFAHTSGLRVVSPSTPHDAYWMIQDAIASNDPVIFLEPKSRYWPKGDVDLTNRGAKLHSTQIAREGTEVTLLGHGAMVSVLLQAAELAAEEGTSVEVLDLRSISPIDYDPILASVRKTGRLVVAQEAPGFVSVGSEIAATVTEHAFYSLEAPVLRVAGFDAPFPPAKLETIYLPDADRVLEAVDRALAY